MLALALIVFGQDGGADRKIGDWAQLVVKGAIGTSPGQANNLLLGFAQVIDAGKDTEWFNHATPIIHGGARRCFKYDIE